VWEREKESDRNVREFVSEREREREVERQTESLKRECVNECKCVAYFVCAWGGRDKRSREEKRCACERERERS
jgi:hypothetical protein